MFCTYNNIHINTLVDEWIVIYNMVYTHTHTHTIVWMHWKGKSFVCVDCYIAGCCEIYYSYQINYPWCNMMRWLWELFLGINAIFYRWFVKYNWHDICVLYWSRFTNLSVFEYNFNSDIFHSDSHVFYSCFSIIVQRAKYQPERM